jgi:hypothetical protein
MTTGRDGNSWMHANRRISHTRHYGSRTLAGRTRYNAAVERLTAEEWKRKYESPAAGEG